MHRVALLTLHGVTRRRDDDRLEADRCSGELKFNNRCLAGGGGNALQSHAVANEFCPQCHRPRRDVCNVKTPFPVGHRSNGRARDEHLGGNQRLVRGRIHDPPINGCLLRRRPPA